MFFNCYFARVFVWFLCKFIIRCCELKGNQTTSVVYQVHKKVTVIISWQQFVWWSTYWHIIFSWYINLVFGNCYFARVFVWFLCKFIIRCCELKGNQTTSVVYQVHKKVTVIISWQQFLSSFMLQGFNLLCFVPAKILSVHEKIVQTHGKDHIVHIGVTGNLSLWSMRRLFIRLQLLCWVPQGVRIRNSNQIITSMTFV